MGRCGSRTVRARTRDGGVWRRPWTEKVQSEWLNEFLAVALSKSFVETISWHSLADNARQPVPHGGLLRADLTPKAAYKQLVKVRSEILGDSRGNGRGTTA